MKKEYMYIMHMAKIIQPLFVVATGFLISMYILDMLKKECSFLTFMNWVILNLYL